MAVNLCAGRLVIRWGKTEEIRSLGIGLDERKPLLAEGIVDEDENNRLYAEMLEFACNGEVCGEL